MMTFVWYYNIREFVNQNLKPIRILKHGRKLKSIFRYGLDIVAHHVHATYFILKKTRTELTMRVL